MSFRFVVVSLCIYCFAASAQSEALGELDTVSCESPSTEEKQKLLEL